MHIQVTVMCRSRYSAFDVRNRRSRSDPTDVSLPSYHFALRHLHAHARACQVWSFIGEVLILLSRILLWWHWWQCDMHSAYKIEQMPLCSKHTLQRAGQDARALTLDLLAEQFDICTRLAPDLSKHKALLPDDYTSGLCSDEQEKLCACCGLLALRPKSISEPAVQELLEHHALVAATHNDDALVRNFARMHLYAAT